MLQTAVSPSPDSSMSSPGASQTGNSKGGKKGQQSPQKEGFP